MRKKLLAMTLCAMMILGLVGCNFFGGDSPEETQPEETESEAVTTEEITESVEEDEQTAPLPEGNATTTKLHGGAAGIRILGERRSEAKNERQINCDWSGSGIEFVLHSLGGYVSFDVESDAPCYFRAYVDGTEWKTKGSPYYTVNGRSTIVLNNMPEGDWTVRLIKVTDQSLASAQLYSVTYYGTIEETEIDQKELYVEFIGDDAAAGWNLAGAKDGTYAAQDGSLAYPYLLAQKLNADYSITTLSGQGLIYRGDDLPNLYDAYLMSAPKRDDKALYGFTRQADFVVLNLGTTDYANREKGGITAEDFAKAYKKMIRTVRQINGEDCKIICVYNAVNETFADAIISVYYEMGGSTAGLYCLQLDRTATDYPNAIRNQAYADALACLIESLTNDDGGDVEGGDAPTLDTEASGDGMSVDVSQFQPLPNKR